jgi:hypothetical protein
MRYYVTMFLYLMFGLGIGYSQKKIQGKPFIRFASSEVVVNNDSCQFSVKINHNIPYLVRIEPSYADKWVKWSLSDDVLIIDVAKRERGSVRECNIIAYSKDKKFKDTFRIKEDNSRRLAGKYNNPIYFVTDGLSLDSDSISRRIYIKNTIPYSLKIEPSNANSWVRFTPLDSSIIVHIMKNSLDKDRDCYIIASSIDNKYRARCHIRQHGKKHKREITNTNNINTSENQRHRKKTVKQGNISSGRCQAITRAGYRCTRTASRGSVYCWQHNK